MQRILLLLVVAASGGLCAGCHLPLLHPIRLREGPWVSVSGSAQAGDGRGGSCSNVSGCMDGVGGASGISVPQLAAGYSHLFNPNVGFLVGGELLTMRNQRLDEWYAASSFVFFGTVQTEDVAVGGGFDVGAGSVTLEAATEVTLARFDSLFDLGITAYARRTFPWTVSPSPSRGSSDFNPSVPSYELGARLSIGPFFVQYAYVRLDRGFIYYEAWETAGYSEGLHTFTLGVLADGRVWFDL
jgi:hypothetical protein